VNVNPNRSWKPASGRHIGASLFRLLGSVVVFVWLLLTPCDLSAVEAGVSPPFGLLWGESEEAVEATLKTANARIVDKKQLPTGETRWNVEGLPQDGLGGVVFTFAEHRLADVELRYGHEDWTAEMYDEFVRRVRAQLDGKLGESKLLAKERKVQGAVLQTLVAYRWGGGGGIVKLVYFSAQDRNNLFRMASLHYSWTPPAPQP
jgi:hypothetical protein